MAEQKPIILQKQGTQKFDLTTEKGLKIAALFLSSSVPAILYKIIKVFLTERKETQLRQAKMAADLIKQGKESGVDEMEITMNNIKGLKINVPIDELKIDTVIGADDTITMKVKYK